MKKLFLLTICLTAIFWSKAQQTITFSEYFDYYYGYCPGDAQYDNWVTFRGSLDTTADKFLKITMRGTYDQVGKSCSDKYVVRQIADALYNGYDLSIQCGSDMWYVGTGCSDYNCGNSSEYIELTTNQYGTCNCGSAYTIRPGMTTPNWGGINTETCQWWYQNANQTMAADVLRLYQTDNLSVTEFIAPDECVNTQDLKVEIMNLGTGNAAGYKIGYSINGTIQPPVTVSSTINSEEEVTATFKAAYTFTPGNSYQFKVWTYLPNGSADQFVDNDTLYYNYKHTGSPAIPSASDVIHCGNGIVNISATTGGTDSIIWYDASTGGNLLKIGEKYTTPFLSKTTTYFAEANAFKSSVSTLSTTFHNWSYLSYDPSSFNGGMFDITASKLIAINGIKVQGLFSNTNPYYRVYIKEGSYKGYESSSTAWKLIFSDYLTTTGDNLNTIPVTFIPEVGKTYGVYITTDPVSGEDIWAYYGNSTYSNTDLSMSGGSWIYGLFGSYGVYSPYFIDAEISYSTTCVSTARKAVKVTINPKPSGAELLKGSPFNGSYNLGLISQPDVAELSKTLTYELSNPTLYSNAGYGTTWKINSVSLTSQYGYPVNPALYSFVNPSASGNGILTFKADNSVLDSNVVINVNYKDLGPYNCDTIVTRVVHIAPTPKPAFVVDPILCDGSDVVFNNKSSIHSGYMTYKWYFDDGDSSDSQEPIHLYNGPGSYNVKLIATSSPWGIVHDTIIVVNVSEVPVAKFKVINACEGSQVSFINQTTIGSGTIVYTWNFGDNTATSSLTNPKHTYASPNGYSVLLQASASGCIGEAKKNAYQFAKPVADFTSPVAPVCNYSEFSLPNNSTIAQGAMGSLWDFKDGEISTQTIGKHAFKTVGLHSVKLTMVSEFGCTDSITKSLTIKPTPTVDFSVNKLCNIDPSQFTNTSTEYSGITSVYNWTFSDGTTYSTKDVTKTWSLIGPKTVNLKSNLSNGCFAETTKTFNVLIQPIADFSVADVCSGQSATFVNKSNVSQGAINYVWDFGDVSPTSSVDNPTHNYNVATTTTYTVSLINKVAGGCDDTAKQLITVTEIPNCNFTFSNYYVSGNLGFKFAPANSSYLKYDWYFGEGGYSSQTSPIYQYLYNGTFKVKLVATNAGGCSCESIQSINVVPSGLASVTTENIQVFPNPANKQVSIDVSENMIGSTIVIYNAIGQMVSSQVIYNTITMVNTENYTNGFYSIKITKDDKSTYNYKVIVNH